MNIQFKTEPGKCLAKAAIDKRLYKNGWSLKRELETIYYFDDQDWIRLEVEPYDIVIAYDSRDAIGVMVLTDYWFNTFVTSRYRRKGVGRALYLKMIENTKRNYKEIPMLPGIRGSEQFFRKLGHHNVLKF